MTDQTLAKIHEDIIRRQFPSIVVRANPRFSTDDAPVLEAFMVPTERRKEFTHFLLRELPKLLRTQGLTFSGVIPHSEEATRRYYPDIYASVCPSQPLCATTAVSGRLKVISVDSPMNTGRDVSRVTVTIDATGISLADFSDVYQLAAQFVAATTDAQMGALPVCPIPAQTIVVKPQAYCDAIGSRAA